MNNNTTALNSYILRHSGTGKFFVCGEGFTTDNRDQASPLAYNEAAFVKTCYVPQCVKQIETILLSDVSAR